MHANILDLTQVCKNSRKIIIGDLHGTFDCLQELLLKVNYKVGDVIIFTGDLTDRGPQVKECLDFARTNPNTYTILSNHEAKLIRYLRGNKVNTDMMQETLMQCDGYFDASFKVWLESLPYIIKFDENKYVVHAGINPSYPIDKQNEHDVLYIRHFNKERNSMHDHSAPAWYTYDNVGLEKIYFGHQPMPDTHVAGRHIALDGGAVFGQILRAAVIEIDGSESIVEVKAAKAYADLHDYNNHVADPFLVKDRYVKNGLLSKKTYKNLVLYNYTKKCVYERAWDEVTTTHRGIIYDKKTKEIVSYVLPKFFNINETDETKLENLPHLPYEVFEKLDGSFVSCSFHEGEWIVATRGSFDSKQAREAKKIIQEKKYDLSPKYSYIFEVIYPENRLDVGQFLVVNYDAMRDVVLTAMFHKNTLLTPFGEQKAGDEAGRLHCQFEALRLGMPISKKYDINLDQALENQKTLPTNEEGYVIRYENGLRLKIKGNEYLKMQKELSGITTHTIWNAFTCLDMPVKYLQEAPEEVRPQVEAMAKKILNKMDLALFELKATMMSKVPHIDKTDPEWRKTLGLWLKTSGLNPEESRMVFPWMLGQTPVIFQYIKDKAKPNGFEV